jgi:hypothetical protein
MENQTEYDFGLAVDFEWAYNKKCRVFIIVACICSIIATISLAIITNGIALLLLPLVALIAYFGTKTACRKSVSKNWKPGYVRYMKYSFFDDCFEFESWDEISSRWKVVSYNEIQKVTRINNEAFYMLVDNLAYVVKEGHGKTEIYDYIKTKIKE